MSTFAITLNSVFVEVSVFFTHVNSVNNDYILCMSVILGISRLQKKCQEMLFLSCSKRRKAEELLWKHVVYGVISQCKQCKEV